MRSQPGKTLYNLTWRRYRQGVMMPMRLDITITSAGHVIGLSCRPVADPLLPAVALTEAQAQKIVKESTGKSPIVAPVTASI
ncbi:hypothetical protein [Streptomyces griseosporeus]|uniref:hypothetical protein n=1 Tax=Streptomyces griseosporeus TaxID=1910 RepID=UPI00368899DA